MLVGSPELVLPERRCSAAAPLVFSGHRLAFRCSPDAAGAPPHRPDLPQAAQGLVPLDGGLGLPVTQNTQTFGEFQKHRQNQLKIDEMCI